MRKYDRSERCPKCSGLMGKVEWLETKNVMLASCICGYSALRAPRDAEEEPRPAGGQPGQPETTTEKEPTT